MRMLSDDDLNIRGTSLADLESAWDLWFDLASAIDAVDPPYSHGVFVGLGRAGTPIVTPGRPPDASHDPSEPESATSHCRRPAHARPR